jgi:hypothetical protein
MAAERHYSALTSLFSSCLFDIYQEPLIVSLTSGPTKEKRELFIQSIGQELTLHDLFPSFFEPVAVDASQNFRDFFSLC